MPFTRMVQVGRVVYIADGNDKGKLAVIVHIINSRRVLIDGPCSGVKRQEYPLSKLQLTKFMIHISLAQRTRIIKKIWKNAKIAQKWASTVWFRRLKRKNARANLTDFERFQVNVLKARRSEKQRKIEFAFKKAKAAQSLRRKERIKKLKDRKRAMSTLRLIRKGMVVDGRRVTKFGNKKNRVFMIPQFKKYMAPVPGSKQKMWKLHKKLKEQMKELTKPRTKGQIRAAKAKRKLDLRKARKKEAWLKLMKEKGKLPEKKERVRKERPPPKAKCEVPKCLTPLINRKLNIIDRPKNRKRLRPKKRILLRKPPLLKYLEFRKALYKKKGWKVRPLHKIKKLPAKFVKMENENKRKIASRQRIHKALNPTLRKGKGKKKRLEKLNNQKRFVKEFLKKHNRLPKIYKQRPSQKQMQKIRKRKKNGMKVQRKKPISKALLALRPRLPKKPISKKDLKGRRCSKKNRPRKIKRKEYKRSKMSKSQKKPKTAAASSPVAVKSS